MPRRSGHDNGRFPRQRGHGGKMQFIVNQALARHQALRQLARELSLTLAFFENVDGLGRQLRGDTRRIVMLTDGLPRATGSADFSIISKAGKRTGVRHWAVQPCARRDVEAGGAAYVK